MVFELGLLGYIYLRSRNSGSAEAARGEAAAARPTMKVTIINNAMCGKAECVAKSESTALEIDAEGIRCECASEDKDGEV